MQRVHSKIIVGEATLKAVFWSKFAISSVLSSLRPLPACALDFMRRLLDDDAVVSVVVIRSNRGVYFACDIC